MMAMSLGRLYLGSQQSGKDPGLLGGCRGHREKRSPGCSVLPLLVRLRGAAPAERETLTPVSSKGTPASPCPGKELLVD